ncbi:DNA polymerase alpha subunit B [Lachnellula suecica]|uniref:DNA polymerase alpha subunit B n=1 Tax=Lachnellula suecica TaxID=602035 RepID=A0A8T9BT81_9HELO|nr:DNA polymerase alpha subunit B [Lachnellula suecica]
MSESELKDRFIPAACAEIEGDVLTELQSIMRLHSIDVQELWYKWESYSLKMGMDDMKLNIDTAKALKKDVQDGLERESRGKVHLQTNKRGGATPRNVTSSGDVFGMLDGLSTPKAGSTSRLNGAAKRKTETPSMSRVKAEPASSPPEFKTPHKPGELNSTPISFHDRANAGQAVEVLNDHLPAADPPIAPFSEPRIKLVGNSDIKKLSYKPLAMKSSEASEILDDRIDEFMALVQAHHNLEDSAFGSAASQSTSEIVAVGRIASDSLEGKLNASSIVLETSRRMGAGLRIPLKLDSLPGFQFFPGQIVALKGINASGENFTVSEILEMPLLGSAASSTTRLEEHVQRLRGGPDAMESDRDPAPLNILIGSGPYTPDDNLDFEPLHALCSQAADTYADALILTGPFLDIDHPLIASGDFDLPEDAVAEPDTATMNTVFKYFVSPAFVTLVAANPHITIILVPSVKDIISKHVSWPQEPFPRKDLGLPKSVKIIGNPMTLSLNEIAIGISSQDILTELRTSEITGGRIQDSSMLARLPKYLIEQRNFSPLFPSVDRENLPKTGTAEGKPAGSMLDTSFLRLGEMVNVRPDLLVVPSALPPFAKVVESVLVVNPGYLSKRRAAGTYTRLMVYPAKLTDEERTSGLMVGHKLFDRTRVDVLRI